MVAEWTPLALVGTLLKLASTVISLAGNAQRYRKKCTLLQGRVQGIVDHLNDLQRSQCTPDPPAMVDTLESLKEILRRAQDLVESCQRKRKALDFLSAHKNTSEFAALHEEMSNLTDNFHIANRTLIMGLYSDRIFMVVLRMLLQSDAGRRVLQLQHNRAVVEECINEIRCDVNNMTPEKIEIRELIKGILALGPEWRDAPEGADYEYENEIKEVENIAKDIVLKADGMNHNKEEVQRVAQLARHVQFFLPNLRFPQMARHHETRRCLNKLRDELKAVNETIESRPVLCGGPAVMVRTSTNSFKEQAKFISGHGNSIEQCLQSLTFIALNQFIRSNA